MKKMKLIILLLLFCIPLVAPSLEGLFLIRLKPINPYENIKHAIGMIEVSGTDTFAVNVREQAYGYFQIRQVRLNDYFEQTGVRYTLKDMLEYKEAEKVFDYYARKIGYPNTDLIIRRWNGSGPKTFEYLRKVKKHL